MREGSDEEGVRRAATRPAAEREEIDPPRPPFTLDEGDEPGETGGPAGRERSTRPSASPSSTPSVGRASRLVLPGRHRVSRRRRRHEGLLWAGAFLLVIGALGWALYGPIGEPEGPIEFRTIEPSDTIEPALRAALVSLSDAIAAYGERAGAFERRRLGCEGLREGYAAAEEAFAVLSARLTATDRDGPAEPALGDARRAMAEVERHFAVTRCPADEVRPARARIP
ncbi:MAG: hypothetical protein ACRELC_12235 [Gemmatimonadota bacterium]